MYRRGEALYRRCSYIEETALYVIIKHVMTVQWESRDHLSIITMAILYYIEVAVIEVVVIEVVVIEVVVIEVAVIEVEVI